MPNYIIPNEHGLNLKAISMDSELVEEVDLEKMYVDHARANFDLEAIEKSGFYRSNIIFDITLTES